MGHTRGSAELRSEPDRHLAPIKSLRPKVLVIAGVHWASTTRLCLALADADFEVAAVAVGGHAVHEMTAIAAHKLGRTRAQALSQIATVIARFAPDLVIPGDEVAIGHLRALHALALKGSITDPRRMIEVIETSLGPSSSFVFGHKKSRFVSLARAEGLWVPTTAVVRDIHELRRRLAGMKFPLVLKRDDSCGGQGARIVASANEALCAFAELRSSSGVLAAIKQAVKKLDWSFLERCWQPGPIITLQQYVDGRPANRAVVCWKGRVLCGLSVEALQTQSATAPATVVRVIESRAMSHAAASIVRRLGLSGFVGFDFILETASGRPYLLEMNARPTQICHLALDTATDMIGALLAQLSGAPRRQIKRTIGCQDIALFPQERWRDPSSEYLSSAYHDVPVRAPEFVLAYRDPVAPEPPNWIDVTRRYLRAGGALSGPARDVPSPPAARRFKPSIS